MENARLPAIGREKRSPTPKGGKERLSIESRALKEEQRKREEKIMEGQPIGRDELEASRGCFIRERGFKPLSMSERTNRGVWEKLCREGERSS